MTTHDKFHQIRQLVHAEPFRPFVVRMRSGYCYPVPSAQVAMLGYLVIPLDGGEFFNAAGVMSIEPAASSPAAEPKGGG
jgi:hypothetical protein